MSQIARNITGLARYSFQYLNSQLEPLGLKGRHASYLTEICQEPGISQDTLAQRICVSKSNVARQLAVLEDEGFISRIPCREDKRVLQLYPTDKALTLLPKILTAFTAWEELLTRELNEEEKEVIAALLSRMKSRAREWTEAN